MRQKFLSMFATFLAFEAVITAPALTATPTTVVDLGYTLQQGYLNVCSVAFTRTIELICWTADFGNIIRHHIMA